LRITGSRSRASSRRPSLPTAAYWLFAT
jgi:hypothetical protein